MSTLLVSGCSFSDPNWKSIIHPEFDSSYEKWPELLNGPWDNIVNTSESGSDNEGILLRAIQQVHLDESISHVIIALTQWYRWTPYIRTHNPAVVFYAEEQDISIEKHGEEYVRNLSIMSAIEKQFSYSSQFIEKNTNKSLLLLFTLIELCEAKNIKFIGLQMLSAHGFPKEYKRLDHVFEKELLKSNFFMKIDEKVSRGDIQFPSWPILDAIVTNVADEAFQKQRKFKVSDLDGHPNADGHKAIAEWINANVEI